MKIESPPRLIISGLSGDAGKTLITSGLARSLSLKMPVAVFKKGPDYIDMAWLSLAARSPCYNLDLFFTSRRRILESFISHSKDANLAIIEGNRGLYDGLDVRGSASTVALARILKCPIILIVNCTKTTRTVAALVFGCLKLEKRPPIKGVILNQIAYARHERIIRESIKRYCDIPIVGAIPKLKNVTFPGRHLGLVPPQEHPKAEEALNTAAEIVNKYLDLELIRQIASQAPSLTLDYTPKRPANLNKVKIGIIKDSAFQFYYYENLEALKSMGAELIPISALTTPRLPDIDALYIGGGFPETHAEALANNKSLRRDIKKAAEAGLPIYAECGGLMYLCKELIWQDKRYPMVGLFDLTIGATPRPQGHGYTIAEVIATNPFYRQGLVLKGHEFHYSYVIDPPENLPFVFKLQKGRGINGQYDGLVYKNVLATYTHIHALSTNAWVKGLINQAKHYQKRRKHA